MRALVIDDSRTVRIILRQALAEAGLEVAEAANGQEGLDRLRAHEDVGLVLVDWNMPVMNGLEFVRAVRARREYDAVRIMMVTTESEASQVQKALDAGANEYVMKPFTDQVLREKLLLLGFAKDAA